MSIDATPYKEQKIDQFIGSIMEAWITRDTGAFCRFCATQRVGRDVEYEDRFCSEECRDAFERVFDARIAIGERDLEQRGYD